MKQAAAPKVNNAAASKEFVSQVLAEFKAEIEKQTGTVLVAKATDGKPEGQLASSTDKVVVDPGTTGVDFSLFLTRS